MFNNALQPTTTPSIVPTPTPTPSPVYPLAPGRYRIRNSYAAKYMRSYNNGTADNTKVVIYPYLSDASEQFDLEQAGDGTYYIKSVPSGKYLMNYNGGTANNNNIVIYPLNGSRPDIKFILENAGSGYYRIKHVNSGKYLRVESSTINTNVVLYTLSTSSNMK